MANELELIDVDLELEGTPVQGPPGPRGPKGEAGNDGTNGVDGTNGINGIDGLDGRDGANGVDGTDGVDGHDGIDGEDGLTAYELWLLNGHTGTVMDFLASLVGPEGPQGPAGADSTVPGPQGNPGTQGIQGPIGPNGNDGADGEDGADGRSAYQVAVANGFVGTEAAWLASLKGAKGDTGTQGIQGIQGIQGVKGEAGTGLNNKGDWVAATYQSGDYVFAAGSTADVSMWILRGDVDYVSSVQPNTDTAHWIEFEAPAGQDGEDGSDGTNGREVELSNDGTNVRWRYVGDAGWNVLISVAAITGPKGDKGDTGNAGTAGTNGTNGKTLLNGIVVPTGAVGADGDFYINTATNLMYGPKAAGAWPAGFSVVGPQGIQGIQGTAGTAGTNGNTILTVGAAPAAGVGVNGDFAYNPTTFTFYGPKAGGAWPAGTVIKGANGVAGNGVSAAAVTYQAHTSGTAAPTGTWSSTVPTVTKGQYLWTRTVTTYTDATTSTAYSVAYQGQDGTGGGGTIMVGSGTGHAAGLAPDPGATAGTTKFLREDATWAVPAGGGGGGSSVIQAALQANVANQQVDVAECISVSGLVSGMLYRIKCLLLMAPNSAVPFKIGFTGTFGPAIIQAHVTGLLGDGSTKRGSIVAKDGTVSFDTVQYASQPNLFMIDGLVLPNGGGTFGVGFAVTTQWNYAQMLKGSLLQLEPTATVPTT